MLDLATADTCDPRWWRKAQFVIDAVDARNMRKLHEYKLQHILALLDYQLEADQYNQYIDMASAAETQLISDTLPWLATEPEDPRQYIENMRQKYIEVFGDPADPEFQKEIARTCAYLQRNAND